MNPRCMHCGEDAEMCCGTCQWNEQEQHWGYMDTLRNVGLCKVIKDWFGIRLENFKKRHEPVKAFDPDEIPF